MTAEGTQAREALKLKFSDFSRYGKKFDKALATVLGGGVKENVFVPSGRRILTVIGRLGEEFVDPQRPYCSCSDFFYRVMGGKEETCYHLLSYAIASRSGMVDTVKFSDEEYPQVLKAIIIDVFDVMNRS